MENLITIISSGAVSIAVSGVLVFLFRNWISERIKGAIQHEYSEKLETHKAQLQSQNEIEITKLKANLEIAAAERSIKLSRVFEKQAETIAATYQKLLTFRQKVVEYIIHSQSEDFRKQVDNFHVEFNNYIEPNLIYIPKSTADKIRKLPDVIMEMKRKYEQMAKTRTGKPDLKDSELIKQIAEYNDVVNRVHELMEILKDDFQRLLGFPIDNENLKLKNESAI